MSENRVQSLDRTLDIIELLCTEKEGLGVTEIGLRLGLHKSTVHRLINTLEKRGYIEKASRTNIYKLGLKFIEVGSLFLNKLELKTEAFPYLRKLAQRTGQTVHLAILSDREAIYIDKVDVLNSIRMYSQIGRRVPLHCTAIGKILISGMEGQELYEFIGRIKLSRSTSRSILNREDLLKELAVIRQRGWALDNEEHEEGIRCIAAPVLDYTGKIIAAVSISGHKDIILMDRDEETACYVMETAREISVRMGYVTKKQKT